MSMESFFSAAPLPGGNLFFVEMDILSLQKYRAGMNSKYKYLPLQGEYYKNFSKVWNFHESVYL